MVCWFEGLSERREVYVFAIMSLCSNVTETPSGCVFNFGWAPTDKLPASSAELYSIYQFRLVLIVFHLKTSMGFDIKVSVSSMHVADVV